MKKNWNLKSIGSLMLGLLIIVSLTSCDKEPVDERPELPPIESLQMDFSDFEGGAGKAAVNGTYENWTYSVLTVGFWNLYATLASALPVTAYLIALDQDPVYLGDYTWEWSFNFNAGLVEYKAVLQASRLNNQEFTAEMSIGEAASSGVVKWFEGTIRYDHTKASWTIFQDGSKEMLGIEWNKDFVSGEADLNYTYLEEGAQEEGSFIMWQYMPGEAYDASYSISLSESQVEIQWNSESLQGQVKSPAYFQDDLWHCWDSKVNGLGDITCE